MKTRTDTENEIRQSLGDFADAVDISVAADTLYDIVGEWPSIDDVEHDTYWAVIRQSEYR